MAEDYPRKGAFLAMLADGYDCMPEEFEAASFRACGFVVACPSILQRECGAAYAEEGLAADSTVRLVHELLRIYHEEQRGARLQAWARLATKLTEGEWASLWLQHPSCAATQAACLTWERAQK